MNWLDIVILCLAGIGLIKGLYDGMIKQVVSLGAFIIGIYLCSGAALWLKGYLIKLDWFPPQTVTVLSYFLGFVLIVSVVLLAGQVVHKLINVTPLSLFNHTIGGILGLLMTVLFISLLLNMLELLDRDSIILPQEIKVESRFYYSIKNIIPAMLPEDLFL